MAEKATKSVLRPPAASGRPGRPLLVGPEAGLLAVLEAYERLAYAGADRTWTEFSDSFDWTSPVERTLPVPDAGGVLPVARPSEGGWTVSGRWEVARSNRPQQRWLTLPATAPVPMLFAVPAETLWRYGSSDRSAQGLTIGIRDFYVPAGLARPSGAGDRAVGAAFVGVGVAAMALGATRRLAGYVGESWAEEAAELEALLTIVREALRRVLVAPGLSIDPPAGPASWERDLAITLRRVEAVARHAVAVAYGASSASPGSTPLSDSGSTPLSAGGPDGPPEPLAAWSVALLQNLRYSADLLPEDPPADPGIRPGTQENTWT